MNIESIPVDSILPPRFKLRTDIGDLTDLKNSLNEVGLQHPILVRLFKDKYELVAGHRRWVCAKELGWQDITAIVAEMSDREAFECSLVENVQRKELDPLDEARAFKQYISDLGYGSAVELSHKISKAESYVWNRIRLLGLPEEVLTRLRTGRINTSTAQEIGRLTTEKEPIPNASDKAQEIADYVEKTGLNQKETSEVVTLVKKGFPISVAVSKVLESTSVPDFYNVHKPEPEHYNPVKVGREGVIIALRKALIDVDQNLDLVEELERQTWIGKVRYPLHNLVGTALEVQKEFEK